MRRAQSGTEVMNSDAMVEVMVCPKLDTGKNLALIDGM